jgi:hypothetical protein
VPHPPHGAIADPSRWWRYDAPMDPDLVVITPALEGESGLELAGPLPLAEEPRFPEANRLFLDRLLAHGKAMAEGAMARAMAAGVEKAPAAPGPGEGARPS